MEIIGKASNSTALWLILKPFIVTESIYYSFKTYTLLHYWTSYLERRLKGSQVKTWTSNSGGQRIHPKLETQPPELIFETQNSASNLNS